MSARILSLETDVMILYRARTIASRPCRHPEFKGNQPENRIRGRWFTSDVHAAVNHRAGLVGDTEIIAIEMDDKVADTYRVGTTPYTRCGLSPIEHSASPLTDYVVPMYFVMDPIEVDIAGNTRRRDVIDVNAPKRPPARRIVVDLTISAELPLAAECLGHWQNKKGGREPPFSYLRDKKMKDPDGPRSAPGSIRPGDESPNQALH